MVCFIHKGIHLIYGMVCFIHNGIHLIYGMACFIHKGTPNLWNGMFYSQRYTYFMEWYVLFTKVHLIYGNVLFTKVHLIYGMACFIHKGILNLWNGMFFSQRYT